jgi:hypothetical protein
MLDAATSKLEIVGAGGGVAAVPASVVGVTVTVAPPVAFGSVGLVALT